MVLFNAGASAWSGSTSSSQAVSTKDVPFETSVPIMFDPRFGPDASRPWGLLHDQSGREMWRSVDETWNTDPLMLPAGRYELSISFGLTVNPQANGGSYSTDATLGFEHFCAADYNRDGIIDLADIQGFVQGLINGDPEADFAWPSNAFGSLDIAAYVRAYNDRDGCE